MASETFTVAPGDSVSERGTDSSFSTVNPFNFDLTKCAFTADDYLRVVSAAGVGSADALRDYMNEQLKVFRQCANLGSCTARLSGGTGSSTSTPSSGFKSVSSVRSNPSRVPGIRRMQSWRPSGVPDGLCYSKMLKSSVAQAEVLRLGEWPAMSALLRSSARSFQSIEELERFRVVGDASMVHVKAGGSEGSSFLASVAKLARTTRFPEGTLGAVVKAHGCSVASAMPVSCRTTVGGYAKQWFPFVKPEFVDRLPVHNGVLVLSDLFSLPSHWFVPFADVNSLWVKRVDPGTVAFTVFGSGSSHFNSLLLRCLRSAKLDCHWTTWGATLLEASTDERFVAQEVSQEFALSFSALALDAPKSDTRLSYKAPQDVAAALSDVLGFDMRSTSRVETSVRVAEPRQFDDSVTVVVKTEESVGLFRRLHPAYAGEVISLEMAQMRSFREFYLVKLMGESDYDDAQLYVALTRHAESLIYVTAAHDDRISRVFSTQF